MSNIFLNMTVLLETISLFWRKNKKACDWFYLSCQWAIKLVALNESVLVKFKTFGVHNFWRKSPTGMILVATESLSDVASEKHNL